VQPQIVDVSATKQTLAFINLLLVARKLLITTKIKQELKLSYGKDTVRLLRGSVLPNITGALRRYISSEYWMEIGVFEGGWSVPAKFSRSGGRPSRTIFCTDWLQIGQWMSYNFIADVIHTKKLCSRLSSSARCNFRRKTAVFRFWAFFGGLGATHDVYLRLSGKRVVDFL